MVTRVGGIGRGRVTRVGGRERVTRVGGGEGEGY